MESGFDFTRLHALQPGGVHTAGGDMVDRHQRGTAAHACRRRLSTSMDTVAQLDQPAPDFSLPDLQGKLHRLAEMRGRIVLLSFWSAE
ncbi:MAG: redoxin domain-containing protein, partial [Anaerolineae bacterium]|nr:redoxin domain-containing protein [Anaerolineae bacterium]